MSTLDNTTTTTTITTKMYMHDITELKTQMQSKLMLLKAEMLQVLSIQV